MKNNNNLLASNPTKSTAAFGGGCFWCTESVFSHTKGVLAVSSGYAGGITANPTYEQVSTGNTGHAEVVKLEFDPSIIGYEDLVYIFFSVHDPTTLNRQGNDVGSQYRSLILYTDDQQKDIATKIIRKLTKDKVFNDPIVTELNALDRFYPAEDYHKSYFENDPEKPYCQVVIAPKLAKFRKKFSQYHKS